MSNTHYIQFVYNTIPCNGILLQRRLPDQYHFYSTQITGCVLAFAILFTTIPHAELSL